MKIRNLWYVPNSAMTGEPDARATVEIEGLGNFEIANCLTQETRDAIERDIADRFRTVSQSLKEAA